MTTEEIVSLAKEVFPNKAFLTVDDICEMLGCTRKIVYGWNGRPAESRPPVVKLGKEIRYPKQPFLSWLMRQNEN